MDFKQWILSESKFDWETTRISRSVINGIKNLLNEIRETRKGRILYHGDINAIKDIKDFIKRGIIPLNNLEGIPVNVFVSLIPSEKTEVSGFFNVERNLIKLEIDIMLSASSFGQSMNYISSRLRTTIRHELEHYQQDEEMQKSASSVSKANWNSFKSVEDYFLNPGEIAAHVAGFKKLSKFSKTTLRQEIINYVESIKEKMVRHNWKQEYIDQSSDKILQAWLSYAEQRYKL